MNVEPEVTVNARTASGSNDEEIEAVEKVIFLISPAATDADRAASNPTSPHDAETTA